MFNTVGVTLRTDDARWTQDPQHHTIKLIGELKTVLTKFCLFVSGNYMYVLYVQCR